VRSLFDVELRRVGKYRCVWRLYDARRDAYSVRFWFDREVAQRAFLNRN
jgi:hypothetical protein